MTKDIFVKLLFMANYFDNEDEFLKIWYPEIPLNILKTLKIRIGEPLFPTDDYNKSRILNYLQVQENTFNDILFRLSIYRKENYSCHETLSIIMHVESTFSINKRNIEKDYYLKQKNMPKHVSFVEDTKHQKSA